MSSIKLKRSRLSTPLARYNASGQLFCVVCNVNVKNELVWTSHVNGKAHKTELTNLKRKAPDNPQPPPSKVQKLEPASGPVDSATDDTIADKVNPIEQAPPPESSAPLPAGFFDDPKEDAKARGLRFKDPQEAEWDSFVKEIAAEDVKSNDLFVQDSANNAVNRELDQIEEQMVNWQRLITLEAKAKAWSESRVHQPEPRQSSSDSSSDDDDPEAMNWRNKT